MYLRLFLLTFVTFLFQVSLTRLFGYILAQHFTPLCISIALFGLGIGAFIRLLFCDKLKTQKIYTTGFAVMGICLLGVYLSFHLIPHVSGPIAFAIVFFVAAGALTSKFYEDFKARKAHLAYTLDMAGGALACLAVVPLLDHSGPVVVIVGAGAICIMLSATSWQGNNRRAVGVACTVLSAMLILLTAAIHFRALEEFPSREEFTHVKQLTKKVMDSDRGRIVDFEWSSLGRADLYEEPAHPEAKWIFYDQMNPSVMLHQSEDERWTDFMKTQFASFPIQLARPEEMLIIGAGGGFEVELAQIGGVQQIDAVEINPAIVKLAERWAPFTGSLFEQENVNLNVADGRTFLNRTDKRYDLIQMSLVLTGSSSSNTHAFLENHLYTEESFKTMMNRLSDSGCLAIIDDSANRTMRQLVTVLSVMRKRGIAHQEAMERFCVFYNTQPGLTAYRNLLMVFPNGTDSSTYEQSMMVAKQLNLQPLWVPGFVTSRPFSDLGAAGIDQFLVNQPIDVSPVSDDHPLFFNTSKDAGKKWKAVWPLLSIAAVSILFCFLIRVGRKTRSRNWPTHLTAFLIGIGFIFLELGLIQKLTIAIGSPTKVFSVILFSLLLWCGIGSQIGSRIGRRSKKRVTLFCWSVAIVNGIFVYWIQDHYLFENLNNDLLRIVAIVLVLAPLGLVMGMPFPSLLASVESGDDRQLGIIWGINGLASLAGANLWLVVMFLAGGNLTLVSGSICYLLAGLVAIGASD